MMTGKSAIITGGGNTVNTSRSMAAVPQPDLLLNL